MTKGNILKSIIRFSIPCAIGNILQNLYTIVDSVLAGKAIDNTALSAIGVCGSLISLLLNTAIGVMCGFAVAAGHQCGASNNEKIKKTFANSFLLSLIAGTAVSVIGVVFSRQMLIALNTPSNLLDDATSYMRIIFAGMMANILYNFFCEMLRAIGNSKAPLIFLFFSSVLHIALNLLFLFVIPMGVAGAAISNVLSQALAAAMCIVYIRLRVPVFCITFKDMKLDRETVLSCLRTGIPMALTNFIVAFGVIILSFVTNGIGDEYVAAYSTASRIGYIMTSPIFGISTALSVFVAQNMGNRDLERTKKGIRQTILFSFAVSAVLLVIFAASARPLLSYLLNGDVIAVNAGVQYILIRCVAMFALVPASCLKNSLNSMERTLFPTVSGFVEIAIRYIFPLTASASLGFAAVPLTDGVSWLALTAFLLVGYIIEINRLKIKI